MKSTNYSIIISFIAIITGVFLAGYDLLSASNNDLDADLAAIPANFQGNPIIVIDGHAVAPEIIAVWTKDLQSQTDNSQWLSRVNRLIQQEVLVRFSIAQGGVNKDSGIRDQLLYASYNEVFDKWSGVTPTADQLNEYFQQNSADFMVKTLDLMRYSVSRDQALTVFPSAREFLQAIEQPAMLPDDFVQITEFKHQSLTNLTAFVGVNGINSASFIEQAKTHQMYGPFVDANDIWHVFDIRDIQIHMPMMSDINAELIARWQQQQAIEQMSELAFELIDEADIQVIWQE